MSEEKKIFYKTLNNIVATNRIDNEEAYIINNYVSGLENIIKEAREYVHWRLDDKQDMYITQMRELLEILDKADKENK